MKTANENYLDIAKTIINSIDHYREAGRDDSFNIESIADFLKRCYPTPSSTVDLEREAREYYFKKTGNVIAENSRPDLVIGYVDGSNATSQKGLVELIEWMEETDGIEPDSHADLLWRSVQAKATELLTKK